MLAVFGRSARAESDEKCDKTDRIDRDKDWNEGSKKFLDHRSCSASFLPCEFQQRNLQSSATKRSFSEKSRELVAREKEGARRPITGKEIEFATDEYRWNTDLSESFRVSVKICLPSRSLAKAGVNLWLTFLLLLHVPSAKKRKMIQ